MKYGIGQALLVLRPGAEWNVTDDVYTGIEWLDKNQTKPTLEEVSTTVTRLNDEEPMRLLRVERDKRLASCDWRASSDLTISDGWKTYRQALRDLPASASPKLDSNHQLDFSSFTWPTEPS